MPPKPIPTKRTNWSAVALAVVYTLAALVIVLDLFVWRPN
jgi:hypothetical protein